jgi:hypothetical protein
MSGQPYRNASDPEKYRNQYLETLALRANIDKTNFDANQVYKQTGQLPAVTQLADTRTTTEKLADIQGTRLELIKDLKPIADPQFAQLIVQKIEQSPFNTDGSLYTYLVQMAPQLVKEISKQYKYKIKGDMNDAETIVKFIENAFANTKDLSQSVKSFFSSANNQARLSSSDLTTLREQYNIIVNKLLSKISPNTVPGGQIQQLVAEINRKIVSLSAFLNTDAYKLFTTNINAVIANVLPNSSAVEQQRTMEHIKLLQELIEKLPKPVFLQTLLQQIEKSLKNINPELTYKLLLNLDELIPIVEPRLIELDDMINQGTIDAYNLPAPIPAGPILGAPPGVGAPANIPADPALHARLNQLTNQELYDVIQTIYGDNNFDVIVQYHLNQAQREQYAEAYAELQRIINGGQPGENTANSIYEVIRLSQQGPVGIHGVGIRRKGRPKGSGLARPFKDKVDRNKGIQPSPRFISFGKHLINTKKLDDDIISIKRLSGANIKEIPSSKVSYRVGKILRDIVGGKIIDEYDLEELTPEEKIYLHKISKYSDIQDRLNIRSPNKDQEEKEYNQFEIMKGEILSGNDSKELVKKFKSILLKFSREGKLPKGQVTEILTELVELGY